MKRTPLSILVLLITAAASGRAADFVKAQNTSALNTAAAWVNNAVPGAGDVLLWDATYTTPGALASLSQLGGSLSVQGLKVTNVGGTVNTNNIMVGFQATAADTLTLGSGGIDMSAATQALRIQSSLLVSANQTWNIRNANTGTSPSGAFNNGEDFSVDALATTQTINLGGNSVTLTGGGGVTFTSGHTISNGTFNVGIPNFTIQGGSSRLEVIASDATFNINTGGRLHLQCNSGALSSSATINLNGGILTFCSNSTTNAVTQSGPVNVLAPSTIAVSKSNTNNGSTGPLNFTGSLNGSAAVTFNNDQPTAVVNRLLIGGDNSAYSGTATLTGLAGKATRMTSATAGSAAATWNIATGHTLELNAVSVNLGTLNGAGTVSTSAAGTSTVTSGAGAFSGILANGTGTLALTKTGTGTLTLSGANTYTGPTSVQQGTLVMTPAQAGATPVSVGDGATFGVSLTTPGTSVNIGALTTGNTTGATVQFNLGSTGNPTVAPLTTTGLNVAAPTVLKVEATGLTAGTPFPLIRYTGGVAGLGVAGLSLSLPFRVTGTLSDNVANSTVDVAISGISVPAWRGTVNNTWDVDNTGTGGAGTANWFAASGPSTYVQGGPAGTDSVVFDDSVGAGPTTVQMSTTLTPVGVTLNNSAVNYTFTGPGKLSGATTVTKNGTGTAILANLGTNDYSGVTQINAGTLQVGDGTTPGAGSLGSALVTNNARLVVNRPDGLTISGGLGGTGDLVLQSGGLTITTPSTLTGTVSGAGTLTAGGGAIQLAGTTANTNTGATSVTTGQLQLNKPSGIDAVGGDVRISGTGQLVLQAGEQIPDTASIIFTGVSADSIPTQAGLETVRDVMVNSSTGGAAGGQVILRNGFTVTGTGTVQSGILGVGSGHTGTVNAINMTCPPGSSGILRIAGNSAASTLNVGAGGITASGGEIQVKFNTNNQDAILNLAGNFTATGNVVITNGGYTGVNLNVINLTGARSFNIATGTVTTVQPDLAGPGGLIKDGPGQLYLAPACSATYTGDTVLNLGILRVDGSLSGTNIIGNGGGLSGTGTVTAGPLGVVLNSGSSISPGEFSVAGILTINAPAAEVNVIGAVTPAAGDLTYCDLATPVTSDRIVIPSGTLNIGNGLLGIADIHINPLPGFGPGTYTIIETTSPITGTLSSSLTATVGGFKVTLAKGDSDTDLVLNVTAGQTGLQTWRQTHFGTTENAGDAANDADPDKDGLQNLVEYLFGTTPVNAASAQSLVAGDDGANLTLTYSRATASMDDVNAIAEVSSDLTNWTTAGVTETLLSDGAVTQEVKISTPKTGSRRYLRIRVVEK